VLKDLQAATTLFGGWLEKGLLRGSRDWNLHLLLLAASPHLGQVLARRRRRGPLTPFFPAR
jgi:hypothetical protein